MLFLRLQLTKKVHGSIFILGVHLPLNDGLVFFKGVSSDALIQAISAIMISKSLPELSISQVIPLRLLDLRIKYVMVDTILAQRSRLQMYTKPIYYLKRKSKCHCYALDFSYTRRVCTKNKAAKNVCVKFFNNILLIESQLNKINF
jgi:hypothetical protein